MPSAFLNGFSICWIALTACAAAMGADTNQPVSDEALRLDALHAVFAGMSISVASGKSTELYPQSKPKRGEIYFPDALAGETVYDVIGPATNKAEVGASKDIISGKYSVTRQVRFRIFRWPNEGNAGLLAVVQYDFADANPAMSCPTIGLLVHLVRSSGTWQRRGEYLLETSHHFSLQGVRLVDLTGDAAPELVIESDFGGAGVGGSSLQVFSLARGTFDDLLYTDSRILDSDQEGYMQVLDVKRTLQNRGLRFCFSKTTLFERGKWFTVPRVTHPCYKRGDGVDLAPNNPEMPAPLR